MFSQRNTPYSHTDSSSGSVFMHSGMKHPDHRAPLSKSLVLQPPCEVPLFSSLDEGSRSFPSVFSSPYTNSSLCSFLLAIPSSSQSSVAAAISSISTLASLSMSVSTKTRNASTNSFDEQVHISPVSSLVATLATALQSLYSFQNPGPQSVKKSKNVFQPSANLTRRRTAGRPALDRSSKSSKGQTTSLHASGDCNAKGLGFDQSRSDTRDNFDDEAELNSLEIGQNNGSHSKADKMESVSKYLVAGAVSTIIARTFVAPLERLKLEYIVGGAKHNWIKVIQGIWVAEGIGGFWKGNTLNLLRMVPFKSINFLIYDMFCKEILERQGKMEVTNFERLIAGAASGATATLLCIPLDTIRTRLIAPGGETLGGMLGCFHQMVHKEGFLSLYKGLLPALLSMVPAGAVFYGVYDILKAAHLQSAQRELLKRFEAEKAGSSTAKGVVMATDVSGKMSPQLELGPVRTLLYGGIAGVCAELVTYPLEVVRRQLQLQQTTVKMGLIAAFQTIIERDGFGALFSGVVPSTFQVLPSAALSYLVYEFMKSILKIC
eukprot:c23720_g1_i1 orf=503-2143(-)